MRTASSLVLALVLATGPAALAADARATAHSGIVVAVDWQGGALIVGEVGPWVSGDFIEVELAAKDITPGDFATAECVRERGRLVARRVALAELR
jgi:hypothetical protein